MNQLKYVPVFRSRQQEVAVLKSFDFGKSIYPCLEIFMETLNARETFVDGRKFPKRTKTFEESYFPLINVIKADKIFIDLPVHFTRSGKMDPKCADFLQRVIADRKRRTEYMLKFKKFGARVIPVISSYFARSGEKNTIIVQATELREDFKGLGFRVLVENFDRDISQIEQIIKPEDFIILDFGEQPINEIDPGQIDIISKLKEIKATVIIHKSPILIETKNKELNHGIVVKEFINDQKDKYRLLAGSCFSDYAGIKKGDMRASGSNGKFTPALIFYNPLENSFYGFKGVYADLNSFKNVIVPDLFALKSILLLRKNKLNYLGKSNWGWNYLEDVFEGRENGRSLAIYKKVSMMHYLNCIKIQLAQ
jgi:Beta protein